MVSVAFKYVPQPAATTFAFPSVAIHLLYAPSPKFCQICFAKYPTTSVNRAARGWKSVQRAFTTIRPTGEDLKGQCHEITFTTIRPTGEDLKGQCHEITFTTIRASGEDLKGQCHQITFTTIGQQVRI